MTAASNRAAVVVFGRGIIEVMARTPFSLLLSVGTYLCDFAVAGVRSKKALEVAMATKAEVTALRSHLGAIVVVTTLLADKFSQLTKQVIEAQANNESTDEILAEMDETAAKLRAISMTNPTGTNPDGTPADPAPLPDSPPNLTPGDTADPALITGVPADETPAPLETSEPTATETPSASPQESSDPLETDPLSAHSNAE